MPLLLRKPSAWLPLLMSAAALLLLIGSLTMNGVPQEVVRDENTPARIFQLLMAGQLPIIIYFGYRYLETHKRAAALILALQLTAAFVAWASVFILENYLIK
jgi:hypothetical protein